MGSLIFLTRLCAVFDIILEIGHRPKKNEDLLKNIQEKNLELSLYMHFKIFFVVRRK